ncbi:MAG: hypothetical protein ACKOB6_00180 [Candidatus Kapaibacterium sp.]
MNSINKNFVMRLTLLTVCIIAGLTADVQAQIIRLKDYSNISSAPIGVHQSISIREGGFLGLTYIPGTNGKEFWVVSDRGCNIDAANANLSACRPQYDKMYSFPSYGPKIFRLRLNGDSAQIIRTIPIRRPIGLATYVEHAADVGVLHLPGGHHVHLALVFGYAAEIPMAKERKTDNVVFVEDGRYAATSVT